MDQKLKAFIEASRAARECERRWWELPAETRKLPVYVAVLDRFWMEAMKARLALMKPHYCV